MFHMPEATFAILQTLSKMENRKESKDLFFFLKKKTFFYAEKLMIHSALNTEQ